MSTAARALGAVLVIASVILFAIAFRAYWATGVIRWVPIVAGALLTMVAMRWFRSPPRPEA